MSAIAEFKKLPLTSVGSLREAAVPKKRFFGAPRDTFWQVVTEQSVDVAKFDWSGYIFATLLVYLKEKHEIDLLASDLDELANFLSRERQASCIPLTFAHKERYGSALDRGFDKSELCDYYNEFNATEEAEAGEPMMAGIGALRQALNAIEPNYFVLLCIV